MPAPPAAVGAAAAASASDAAAVVAVIGCGSDSLPRTDGGGTSAGHQVAHQCGQPQGCMKHKGRDLYS